MASDPWDQFGDAPPATQALTQLQSLGVEATSGFRTEGDVKRLKRQGYTPAENGDHNRGDGIDLTPGKSGLSLAQLQAKARKEFGPDAIVQIHNGTHVHVAVHGWGLAPDLYRANAWDAFTDAGPAPKASQARSVGPVGHPTGQVHDGDTFRLSTGSNGRLFGVDAFELNQTGRSPAGISIPLGTQARNALLEFATPQGQVSPTGGRTYGRPVVTLDNGGDAGQSLIRQGYALAEPSYLQGSPQFSPYMEAERLARMNQLGAHGNTYQTPSGFRHGAPDPWQPPEQAKAGAHGVAVFADEPTPFAGLRPEIEKAYVEFARTAKSPQDLVAFGKQNGFTVPVKEATKFIVARNKAGRSGNRAQYLAPPRPSIDPGDGAFGSFARGVGDPVNALDEMGGVVDAVGLTPGRENVFNSDRRFGDVLWNNIDQNRAVLTHDEEAHPVARIGGQLTSGVALPMGAASTPLRLGAIMAAEGGIAGFAAGEGGIAERLPNAALGTVIGAAAGPALGLAGEHIVAPLVRRGAALLRPGEGVADDAVRQGISEALPIVNDGVQNAGPTPAARSQPQGGVTAAMAADRGPELVGPAVRQRDYINTGSDPWAEFQDAPFGVTRNVNERLSSEDIAKLAEDVDPRGAIPRPGNQIESLDEAIKANPGRFEELQAPDERAALPVNSVRPANGDLYSRIKLRGPFDITKTLRQLGGIKDAGGDLAHLGITNAPRRLEFGGNEQFLGKLIDNEKGMSLDEAGERLHEMGYFQERPTPAELLDALHGEHLGQSRYLPEDLAQVEEFRAAQGERHRIEAARTEGRPIVEERGHTVNLDDLAANTPPADAYEDMPRLTGKVGNINLDRLEKPQQVAALIDQVAKRVGGFSAASRGKITQEETRLLAQDMGLRPEQLLKRQQGQALNAEQLYASRALVQRSREVVARLARKAVGGNDEDMLTFRKAWLKHVALEEQVAGATTEAGRALAQFRMLARAQDAGADAVRSYLKGTGRKETLEDAAEAIVDLMEDPAKASHFMREAMKPRWRDKFNELWINSLLSGPRTHVVNFVGNALTTTLSFPEQTLAAGIGKLTRSPDRAYFGEVGARAAGLADSSVEALRNMRAAFKTGEPLDASTKVEAVEHQAIGGRLGRIIRTPTRALTASDEFWKTLLGSAELHQIAYRQAKVETHDAEAFRQRYEALLRAPTEEMMKRAQASARYYTFQKPLGEVGRGVQMVSNNSLVGKILLPFVRTPINIIKFAGERSALGLMMPEVRQALRAGGRARDETLARITLGSGLSTAAVVGALDGRISGSGPTDPRERAALLQSGWQPNSIRIGDRWVSYARFDPASTLIGVAADFAEAGKWATRKEADKIALNLAMGIAKNITNKTWLSGLSDAFDVLSDPERYGKGYVQKLAGAAAVPAIASQTAQALDPYLRDARSIMDAIKARIPVVSQSVPARLNVWGEPLKSGDAVGPDIISPFYAQSADKSPFSQEIARLRAPLSMPQRHIFVDRRKVDLSPEQFTEYVQFSGKTARAALEAEMKTPEWRQMTDDERRETVKETLSDMRGAAREALVANHPELSGDAAAPANDPFAEFQDAS